MDYYFFVATIICIWIMVTLSMNLVLGYAGLFSLGHAGYLAVGAYTTAILNIIHHVDYFATLPAAVVVTALVALLTYLPLARLTAFHFALSTLGLNVVITQLIHNLAPRVPGAEGLFGLKAPEFMASGPGRFAVVALALALCLLVAWRVTGSPFGRTLRALRDRPDALEAVGKNPRFYRGVIWTISGALCGLAGGLYSVTLFYIDPTVFLVAMSFNVVVYVGVGGLASIAGSVLGPTLLIAFSEGLRFTGLPSDISGPAQQAIFGALLILLMLFRRRGLMGRYEFRD